MFTYAFIRSEGHWTLPGEKVNDRTKTKAEYIKSQCKRESDHHDINHLWAQLSPTSPQISKSTVMVTAEFAHLLVARNEDGRIKGMATLCILHTLHGDIGRIEDVVVDESVRVQGVGEGLLTRLIEYARDSAELKHLELTSKPSRISANKLYQKFGFEQYDPTHTNHYRLNLQMMCA